MKYVRMYADSNGESHFDDVAVDFALEDYSPPTPPVNVSPFVTATRFGYVGAPARLVGAWHPVPRRQMCFYLVGEMEIEVSDGGSAPVSCRECPARRRHDRPRPRDSDRWDRGLHRGCSALARLKQFRRCAVGWHSAEGVSYGSSGPCW